LNAIDYVGTSGAKLTNDGTGDNSAIIQQMINTVSAAPNGGTIVLPSGIIKMTSGVTISPGSKRVHIRGQGVHATKILFDPTVNAVAFTFKQLTPSVILYQCSLSDMGFDSSAVTAVHKTAVQIENASGFRIANVAVINFNSTDGASIGLRTRGREQNVFNAINCSADIPLLIDTNADPSMANHIEDADHFHFSDMVLMPSGTNSCVKIADGVALSNVIFDGYQAWVGGGHGLYWNSTASTVSSFNLCIRNLRREQGTAGAYYGIYINATSGYLTNLQLDNCIFSSTGANGIYLRGVLYSTFVNVTALSGVALDMDGSAYLDQSVSMMGCFWQAGTTANMLNLRDSVGTKKQYTNMPLPSTAFFAYWNP